MLSIRESNSRLNLIMLYAVNTGAITGCVRPKTQVLQRLLANSVATTAQYRLGPVGDPREFMYLGTVKV